MVYGFKEAKKKVIESLEQSSFQHETRKDVNTKNLLATGDVTPNEVINIIKKCSGNNHSILVHHQLNNVIVHLIKKNGWYIKFYFIDPDTVFISVHK